MGDGAPARAGRAANLQVLAITAVPPGLAADVHTASVRARVGTFPRDFSEDVLLRRVRLRAGEIHVSHHLQAARAQAQPERSAQPPGRFSRPGGRLAATKI